MSALAFARGWEDAGRRGVGAGGSDEEARPAQPRLFALPGGAVDEPPAARAVAAPEVAPRPRVLAPAVAPVRTLDGLLMDTWSAVSSGTTAVCPMCSGAMRPRWSAGAGAVGGRCADCGTIAD